MARRKAQSMRRTYREHFLNSGIVPRRISEHSAEVPIPPTITHGKRGLTVFRAQHEDHLAVRIWAAPRHQKIDQYHHLPLPGGKRADCHYFMLFSRNEWILIQNHYTERVQRRSIVYKSKDKLLRDYQLNKFYWAEHIGLGAPPPSAPDPDP